MAVPYFEANPPCRSTPPSKVDGFAEGRLLGGTLERLREGRMRVADPRDVLGRGPILDCEARLGDELPRRSVDDVHAEKFVCLLAREHLREAVCVIAGFRSGVGGKGKLTLLVCHTIGLELLFRVAHPSHLGV